LKRPATAANVPVDISATYFEYEFSYHSLNYGVALVAVYISYD
jgi:hypothetical protein